MSTGGWTNNIVYETNLTPQEKSLRETVAREYMYDRNLTSACLRIGMSSTLAQEYADRFRTDPYFNWCLRSLEQLPLYQDQNEKEIGRLEQHQRIITMLEKEATYNGPGASATARVQALKLLASVAGLIDKNENKNKDSETVPGVMVVPDSADNVDDWEAIAAQQQENIMKESS